MIVFSRNGSSLLLIIEKTSVNRILWVQIRKLTHSDTPLEADNNRSEEILKHDSQVEFDIPTKKLKIIRRNLRVLSSETEPWHVPSSTKVIRSDSVPSCSGLSFIPPEIAHKAAWQRTGRYCLGRCFHGEKFEPRCHVKHLFSPGVVSFSLWAVPIRQWCHPGTEPISRSGGEGVLTDLKS